MLEAGQIVWLEVRRREQTKRRPAVVLFVDLASSTFDGIAISSAHTGEVLPLAYVPMPFDPTGRATTGLRKRCWAVTSWPILDVPFADVEQVAGVVPANVLAQIHQKLNG